MQDDGHVARLVRPRDGRPRGGERLEQVRSRVAVVVPLPHRHHRYVGVEPGEPGGVLVAAAVVRHLQHVDPQQRVGPRQHRLRLRLHVAGEQHAQAAHLHKQHQARVVGGRTLLPRARRLRSGRQHLPGHRPDPSRLPDRRNPRRDARPRGRRRHRRRTVGWVAEAGGEHLVHVLVAEHAGQPTDVVGMEVRQHQGRHLVDLQPVEAPSDRLRVGSGVDHERPPVAGVEHQTVALPDVARHQHPAVRRPARARQRTEHDESHRHDAARRPSTPRQHPARPPAGQHAQQHEDEQCERARAPLDRCRRQPGEVDAHQHDPAAAEAAEQTEEDADRRHDQVRQPAQQPEHGRRRHGGCDRHVGDHRDQAHLPGQPRDHRRADQLRRQGYGDRLRSPARQPPREAVAKRGREEQDPRRREHRQGEAR